MLEVNDIYKRFNLEAGFFASAGRYVHAVNGVSFTIRNNETYGLVGESGCGKTTTARLLVRMYPLDSGEIVFTDKNSRAYHVSRKTGRTHRNEVRYLREKISYIFQDPARSLNPRMTISDILTSGYRYSPGWPGKKEADREAGAILESVGLNASDLARKPADFSGGQRQRISIARSLIMKPELLICDEVVSALDVSIQSQILSLLLRLKNEYHLHMLFIAHDLSVVSYFCDRVGVMYAGTIVEEAASLELLENRQHPYTKHLYNSIPQLDREYAFKTRQTDISSSNSPVDTPDGATPGDTAALSDILTVPDMTVVFTGCPYYPRCPIRQDRCLTEKPQLKEISAGHLVACHAICP